MDDLAHARSHARSVPRGVLISAGALIAFAIAITLFGRVTDIGVSHMPAAQPYQVVEMRFEDGPDGSVAIHDAGDGKVFYTVQPGADAFIRATVRGLAHERLREGIGETPPFTLTRWSDGTLSLEDKSTGRRINLDAFGPTQAGAFARVLQAGVGAK